MNLADAIFHMVHDYPGGAESLGPRLDKLGTSLSAEVKQRSPQDIADMKAAGRTVPKFGALDMLKAMKLAQQAGRPDLRPLNAMAAELGCMVIRLPDLDGDEGPAAADVAEEARAFGELMGCVAQSLADGRVTDRERAEVERRAAMLVVSTQRLLAGVARMNDELRAQARGQLKPAGLSE